MSIDGKTLYEAAQKKLAATDFPGARRLMKQAAERGHLPAMRMYATFLEQGIGGRKSARKAMNWFEKLASKGDRIACAHLGEWFVEQGNDAKAISWLKRADGARSSLLLVSLWSKSRSVRKTMKAKHLLSRLKPEEFTGEERQLYDVLVAEYSKRNPDSGWSWLNRRQFLVGWMHAAGRDEKALLSRIKPELLSREERRQYDRLVAEL